MQAAQANNQAAQRAQMFAFGAARRPGDHRPVENRQVPRAAMAQQEQAAQANNVQVLVPEPNPVAQPFAFEAVARRPRGEQQAHNEQAQQNVECNQM